ncbi:Ca-activated chloride channel family protein [Lachnospiraceae bacterium PF1-22]
MKKRLVSALLCMTMLSGMLVGCSGRTDEVKRLSEADAKKELSALLTKVDATENTVNYDIDNSTNITGLAAELPDIDTYELVSKGKGSIDVEIFSSTEKAVKNGNDDWLIDVANNFNAENMKVNGKDVSVSIRSIASGTASDYIISGKYLPDGFTPANTLWGDMVSSKGVKLETVSDKLAGNTAGILLSANKYKELEDAGKDVSIETIVEETLNGNILLGYTNPYVSSAGLNILSTMLQTFDSADPLGDASVAKLEQFQSNIPSVAYTTAQMRETAKKGLLDAMVMEYQAYINTKELKDYKFVPFGVRHDSPLYAVGDISSEKKEVLSAFADYCKNEKSQDLANKYGFNGANDYTYSGNQMTGKELYAAQDLWKAKKDAGQPVIAVFVADTSGSMTGTPLAELQTSLLNAANYIGEKNKIGLVSYNTDVYIDLPIGEFNNKQKAGFTGAVKYLSANGGTSTYDAVLVALDMLLKEKEKTPNAKLMLFVLSDGEQSSGYGYRKVSNVLAGLRIPIHSICYGESISEMEDMSALNEASVIKASPEDVIYNLKNVFNAQL